jgi:Na+-transporting NADH:ubiquinone oxidoreductase subunit NqrB
MRGATVKEAMELLPWPWLLAIMAMGLGLVFIACLPTAWVERLLRYLRERFGTPAS